MGNKHVFWASNGLLDYLTSILGGYYTEQALVKDVLYRDCFACLVPILMQSGIHLVCSLYPFVMQRRRRRVREARGMVKYVRGSGGRHQIKRVKLHAMPVPARALALALREHLEYRAERVEKLVILLMMAGLAVVAVVSKLVMYEALKYTTFTTLGIVRSFRLFPVSLTSGHWNGHRPAGKKVAVMAATMGIFIYIFSPEERVENIHFLKNILPGRKPNLMTAEDKQRLIRSGLRFLEWTDMINRPKASLGSQPFYLMPYYLIKQVCGVRKSKLGLGLGRVSREDENQVRNDECLARVSYTPDQIVALSLEEQFIVQLLAGEVPKQHLNLSPHIYSRLHYRGLLAVMQGSQHEDPRVVEILTRVSSGRKDPQTERVVNALSISLLRIICTGPNILLFKAYLEKKKILAAILLALNSWLEVALEAGLVVLFKMYHIEYGCISYGVNLISVLLTYAFLVLYGYSPGDMYACVTRDRILSSLFGSLSRFFSYQDGDRNYPVLRTSLQIGRKFFSLLMSTIFFRHDFNVGHCIGILLMFIGSIMNVGLHSVLLSRWTFSGHLKRRCA
ncbi:hypothetical protein NEHOM01_1950 [Nematocida homosporus]|uniref:uncharacterized protein n=1 Tax=Nematocida homosporus TaxID=1912981 RepID=UPI00221EAF59|nr:uncharacterized protein NEHOM01_1950 [Nematocida homosporus]KAI5187124.1 hypothetical protein NEHOM01_1950 [Nematocida homosporus]